MKKIVVVLMAKMMVFSFAASGSAAPEGNDTDTEKVSDAGNLGDYEVAIKDCRIVQDYEGKDTAAITYEFTNNSEEAAAFDVACVYAVYQDGVELEYTSVYENEDDYTTLDGDVSKQIQPGKTIEVTTTNRLTDSDQDVTVEVEEFLGFGNKKLTKTFSIKK